MMILDDNHLVEGKGERVLSMSDQNIHDGIGAIFRDGLKPIKVPSVQYNNSPKAASTGKQLQADLKSAHA